jgi:beta-galactosidase
MFKNNELQERPLIPNFSRPLTDNDRRGWKPQVELKEWYQHGLKLTNMEVNSVNYSEVRIQSDYSIINEKAVVKIIYTIRGDGMVKVDYNLIVNDSLPNIPKVGMQCGINRNFDKIQWYGRGPQENYIDRRYGADVGIYKMNVEKFMEPYVYPQENGNRTDVRWMYLSDDERKGLLIVADSLLSMSAWTYSAENINNAKHTNELKDAGYINLNIDLVQMGVGGNDTWSEVSAPLGKYQIPARNYSYSFYLVPVDGIAELMSDKAFEIKF